MNVNLHANEQFWNLGLKRITGSFTAENGRNLLKAKLDEFGVSLDTHIIAIVSDGAAVMKKMGRISGTEHQLCFAHAIHLAVTDVLYEKKTVEDEDVLTNQDLDEEEEDDDMDSGLLIENCEDLQFCPGVKLVIQKVRKTVRSFNKSALKTETLSKYTMESKQKALGLVLDCKIRWNSLLSMLERFQLVRHDIQKCLIDFKETLDLNEMEWAIIDQLVSALTPIKTSVQAICRRDSTLFTCDVALNFMLEKLSNDGSEIAMQFHSALLRRINERRNSLSETLRFLHLGKNGKTGLPFKKCSKTEVCDTVLKLFQLSVPLEDSEPLIQEVDEFTGSPISITMEAELNEAIQQALESRVTYSSKKITTSTIKKEIACFENGDKKGVALETVYKFLLTIPPSTVEAERAFSCAGNFCTKLRSRLHDSTLDALVFLKYYYKSRM